MDILDLHDVVALTKALPDDNLRRGETGVIVDVGPDNHYLLEFIDKKGRTVAMPTVSEKDITKVYLETSLVA